jgi:hypothetical protein
MRLAKTTEPAASRIPSAAEFVDSFAAIAAPQRQCGLDGSLYTNNKAGRYLRPGNPRQTLDRLGRSAGPGLLCSYPGTLTFKLSGDAIFVPLEFTVDVKGPGKGPGSFHIGGPDPEAAATFTGSVTYTPKGGKLSAAVSEKQVVTTPEPGTRALMLPRIAFLAGKVESLRLELTLTR